MIQLSTAAAREILRLKSKQQQTNVKFRLAVKPGGCAGLYYEMCFDDKIQPGDRVFECHGLQVVIDHESIEYVSGMSVDYSEDLMGGGFRFHNPQAVKTCGCGNSFSKNAENGA